MKKSLIALAVMAAAGAASAQSSVQLYGIADVWFGSSKTEVSGFPEVSGVANSKVRNTVVESGGVNTSRWGVKGSEDLGGGLKANFNLEQGFNLDNGSNRDGIEAGKAFGRQAWVGVSGGFGEVQVGKVWTSYDDVRLAANDTFNANIAASNRTWVGYADRTDNGLKYISPSYNGFSGSLTLAFGEDKNTNDAKNNSASSLTSLGLHYNNGPLVVGFAHQQQKQNGVNESLFTALPAVGGAQFASLVNFIADDFDVALEDRKTTYNLLNGSYNFGVAKLVGGISQVKHSMNVYGEGSGTAELKANEFNLGVEVPLAANLNLGLGYARSKTKLEGEDLTKATGYTGALVYSLSKRTSVYGALTQAKLEVEGESAQVKSTIYAVGVNHKF